MVSNITVYLFNASEASGKTQDYEITIIRRNSNISIDYSTPYFVRYDSNAAMLKTVTLISFEYLE